MIKRAEYHRDPWSGHMAFPGGRRERLDHSHRRTAERETREEIGLDLSRHAIYLGRLSDARARQRQGRPALMVVPHIYGLSAAGTPPNLRLNYEVAEVHWVPLALFVDPNNRAVKRWMSRQLDCYWYQQRQIWGLSLALLQELVGVLRR